MVKVAFKNVGRNNRTWTAELPNDDPRTLAGEARQALMSAGVDCSDGKVYAGFRPVGEYEILEAEKPKVKAKKKAPAKKRVAKKKATKKKVKSE
jgi:hypothetical protein